MSHLSILPTVLRDLPCLSETLEAFGLNPEPGGVIEAFAAESLPVLLRVQLADGTSVGWSRGLDGSLQLVGDLQRLSRSQDLRQLLGRLTRSYAARLALRDAAQHDALIEFSA